MCHFTCFLHSSYVLPRARSPPRSPDSVLKLKLCPTLPFFPTSSQSDRSSFDRGSRGEYHDQRKQLLSNSSPPPHYTLFESHLGSQAPSPTALESISRGPDGRFIVQPLPESSSPSNIKNLSKTVLQSNGSVSGSGSNRTSFRDSPKSSVLSSERDERKGSPLTVDVPELSRPPASPGRVRAMARNFSRHGCFYSDDEQGSETLLERASFYSDNSEKKSSDSHRKYRVPGCTDDLLPHFGRRAKLLDRGDQDKAHHSGYQAMESLLTDNSTMVSQLDSELEKESISRCVQLAKEREEIERDLRKYAADQRRRIAKEEHQSPKIDSPRRHESKSDEEPVWKPQDVTIRQKNRLSGVTSRVSDYRKACYFGNTSSPLDRASTSRIQWDISPVTSVTSLTQKSRQTTSLRTETTDDSPGVESLSSPVTQNTSLPSENPILCLETPDSSSSPHRNPPERTKSDSEHRETPVPECSRLWESEPSSALVTKRDSSASGDQTEKRAEADPRDPSPSGYPTLKYEHHEVAPRAKEGETYSELEREGNRARSRKSDKCLFSDSPTPISTLTLVEEGDSEQSQLSVPRISDSFKTKPAAPSPKMSPVQTSAILEYLSLPGFIEMSVDEPVEEAQVTDSAGQSSEINRNESAVAKPDVVPKNWEVHVQEKPERVSSREHCVGAAESSQSRRSSSNVETRVKFPDDTRASSSGLEKTSKQLYDEKTRIRAGNASADRPESRLGSRSAHTLLSAAKGMADIVSKHSEGFADSRELLSDQSQRQAPQGSRTNNIVSRITQVPVPFLKKSFSLGPCRTLSGHPRPFLKKSISLGSQRWEHFETPRTYVSERCYWDEFPNPDVRVKSYSLGRTPSSLPMPGPSWREYIPLRRPSMGSLERPHHVHRSFASPSYLSPSVYPPHPTSVSPILEPCDPRRQAAVFPESSRWSPSYPEAFRPPQHPYVHMPASIPVPSYQHWPGSRGESLRPFDSRRGPPRSYLPRGISWPSPYYTPSPHREGDSYRPPDRMMSRGGDPDIRDGGRASYASQSSGRGSAGFFRQSLSITPTLLSSPETTEENERHRAEAEPPQRRVKR